MGECYPHHIDAHLLQTGFTSTASEQRGELKSRYLHAWSLWFFIRATRAFSIMLRSLCHSVQYLLTSMQATVLSGVYSAIPSVVMIFVMPLSGQVADHMRSTRYFSTTSVRKIFGATGTTCGIFDLIAGLNSRGWYCHTTLVITRSSNPQWYCHMHGFGDQPSPHSVNQFCSHMGYSDLMLY